MIQSFSDGASVVSYMTSESGAPLAKEILGSEYNSGSHYGGYEIFYKDTAQIYGYAFNKYYSGPDKFGLKFNPTGKTFGWDYETTYLIFDISSGGAYFENECTDCNIIGFKVPSTNNRFSVCKAEDIDIVIYGTTTDSRTAYLYYDNQYLSVGTALQNYITAKKALSAGIADKYIAQPIILGGMRTPLYSIVSNASAADLDLFVEVAIGGQKFFVVDYGIGVKAN